MEITDPKCGKTWTGMKLEHCTGCHETFSTTWAGDQHRQGSHHDRTRHCVNPAEVGLVQDGRGTWRKEVSASDAERLRNLRGTRDTPAA